MREAIATLRGEGPPDLLDLALALGSQLLLMADRAPDVVAAGRLLRAGLAGGEALARLRAFVANQGGDPAVIDHPERLPAAPFVAPVAAPRGGHVAAIDAEALGLAAVTLGAGRATKGAAVDHAVGFVLHRKIGETVAVGEPLLEIHARTRDAVDRVRDAVAAAFTIQDAPVQPPPLILGIV